MAIRMLQIAVAMLAAATAQPALADLYVWQPVTSEQAIAMVRAFEGDPQLAVALQEVRAGRPTTPPHFTSYILASGEYAYSVSVLTCDWFLRRDPTFDYGGDLARKEVFYGQPYQPAILAPLAMSQGAAEAAARAVVMARCPGASRLSLTSTYAHAADRSSESDPEFVDYYEFRFRERLANGCSGPAECTVAVDTIRARIISFAYSNYPLLRQPVAQISAEQALLLGVAASGLTDCQLDGVEFAGVDFPDGLGYERFVYRIRFHGLLPGQEGGRALVAMVDGDTGEVFDLQPTHGTVVAAGRSSRARIAALPWAREPPLRTIPCSIGGHSAGLGRPPVVVGGTAYLYGGYLCAGVRNARITFHRPGRVCVTGQGRRVSLDLRSATAHINGRAVRLRAHPILVRGRCYVPCDLIAQVLGYEARLDDKTGLHLTTKRTH